jgi:hypothetical protein
VRFGVLDVEAHVVAFCKFILLSTT